MREPGYYWVRHKGHAFVAIEEWDGTRWLGCGSEGGLSDAAIEVLSDRIRAPKLK